jgi:hypothetical protein
VEGNGFETREGLGLVPQADLPRIECSCRTIMNLSFYVSSQTQKCHAKDKHLKGPLCHAQTQ